MSPKRASFQARFLFVVFCIQEFQRNIQKKLARTKTTTKYLGEKKERYSHGMKVSQHKKNEQKYYKNVKTTVRTTKNASKGELFLVFFFPHIKEFFQHKILLFLYFVSFLAKQTIYIYRNNIVNLLNIFVSFICCCCCAKRKKNSENECEVIYGFHEAKEQQKQQ